MTQLALDLNLPKAAIGDVLMMSATPSRDKQTGKLKLTINVRETITSKEQAEIVDGYVFGVKRVWQTTDIQPDAIRKYTHKEDRAVHVTLNRDATHAGLIKQSVVSSSSKETTVTHRIVLVGMTSEEISPWIAALSQGEALIELEKQAAPADEAAA